ncbi:MAG: hypothetical protein LBL75_02010 [Rickettsiales bacterium]|jgi:glutamyl-tRNA synthetase|nr:hypothetical protein [Rickettsiales bacterium]
MRPGLSENLIKRLLPNAKYTIAELEQKFPLRNLPDGAMVTRFAPSPTGYMHIGGLYQMLLNWKLAKQSDGVFMLRIEDTDIAREVDGAISLIMGTQNAFWLQSGEGPVFNANNEIESKGDYGTYLQSHRKDIYHSVAAEFLRRGAAYPCFLTAENLSDIRAQQTENGEPTGIYGAWARDRDLSESEIIAHLDNGEIPSIRFYSDGDPSRKVFVKDASRGSIAMPENNVDEIIIKSTDGLPTYHFAHVVDDHFMRTTHVVRGEEWLPSTPKHLQMFGALGWTPPVYVHTSTIDKIDDETGKQRKISKRKDPEANVDYFIKEGYPPNAVLEYLLNIMSSRYEEEKTKNPGLDWRKDDYKINIKKIPTSGALYNPDKLDWWAKEYIAGLSAGEIYKQMSDWNPAGLSLAYTHTDYVSSGIYTLSGMRLFIDKHQDYLIDIFGIERDNPKRVRKDFITWKQTVESICFFFDKDELPEKYKQFGYTQNTEFEYNKNALDAFVRGFNENDDKNIWWNKIVQIASDMDIKNGDVAMNLRVAITGRAQTPDLYSIMQVMEKHRPGMVKNRINKIING